MSSNKNGTYKTYKVTDAWLDSHGACYGGREWFKTAFPKGVTISNSQEEMCELVSGVDEGEYSDSYRFLLWFANMISGRSGGYLHPLHINDVELVGLLISEAEVFA